MAVDDAKLQEWKKKEGFAGFLIEPAQKGDRLFEESAQKVLSGLGHPHLMDDVRALAQHAGLKQTPLVFIDRLLTNNAEAQKLDGQHVLVLNNTLLRTNNRKQLAAVITHELAHITEGHTRNHGKPESLVSKALTSALFNRFIPYLDLYAPWKKRRQERKADMQGAVIAGGIEGAKDFFQGRIEDQARFDKESIGPFPHARPADVPFALARHVLNSPLVRSVLSIVDRLDSTHPSYEKSIKNLEKFARKHPEKLQASKTGLNALWGKAGNAFADAAPRAPLPFSPPMPAASTAKTPLAAKPAQPEMMRSRWKS